MERDPNEQPQSDEDSNSAPNNDPADNDESAVPAPQTGADVVDSAMQRATDLQAGRGDGDAD